MSTQGITHIDPEALHRSPVYAHGAIVETPRTLYVGGQNGTDADGAITGDVAAQAAQAVRNLLAVLTEAGSGPEHVARLTIHLHQDADLHAAYGAAMQVWGGQRTAVTALRVAGLARPEALIEIDAIAAVP